MTSKVFLGLVTHARTRFPENAGPEGLVARLGCALTEMGTEIVTSVHDADLHDSSILPLTNAEVHASIKAELGVEHEWRRQIHPELNSARLLGEMTARRIYRQMRLDPPWHFGANATSRGAAMLRRLVNIELAHLSLMREAVTCGSEWALIVEDDAQLEDAPDFASALDRFIRNRTGNAQPRYVNVSRSFPTGTLGIDHLLTPVGVWDAQTRLLSSDRPVTNTVCGILYRTDFVQELLHTFEEIPISPVLPIDWKLNQALLILHRNQELGASDCWFLDPAPILQGSMHEP